MIETIHVQNLRALADVNVSLSPQVTLVLGDNGAGKSSIAGAVQYALAGYCEWTDKGGAGYADLIRHGAKQTGIGIETAYGHIIKTLSPKGTQLSVGERSGKDAEAVLTANLPSTDLLMAMLRSDGFIGLPTKEQTDILFALSGGEVNADWVKGHLDAPEATALSEDLATLLKGSSLMDGLYKAAYAMRTEANRAAKDAKAKAEGMTMGEPLTDPVRQGLEQEQHEIETQLTAKQRALGASDEQAKTRQQAQARHSDANQTLSTLRDQRKALGEMPKASGVNLEGLRGTRQELLEQGKAAFENAVSAGGQIKALEQSVDIFSALGVGKCVLGGIACPLDDAQREVAVKSAQQRIDELREENKAHLTMNTDLEKQADAIRDEIAQGEQANAAASEHIRRAEAIDDKIKVAEAAKATAEQEYKAIEVPDTGKISEEIAKLEGRKLEITASLSAHLSAMNQAKAKLDAGRAAETATGRATMLDALVKKLEPAGLPAVAMQETVGNVIDQVNAVLSSFTDFTLKLEGDELVVTRGGADTAVRLLSESEQLRVGAAISVAFAKLTKFGFVIVDAADRLDSTNRGPLIGMLLQSGVQALVTATPLNGKRPRAPGLSVYDLADGRLVEAETAQEVAA